MNWKMDGSNACDKYLLNEVKNVENILKLKQHQGPSDLSCIFVRQETTEAGEHKYKLIPKKKLVQFFLLF
jgi:hypothetical protein